MNVTCAVAVVAMDPSCRTISRVETCENEFRFYRKGHTDGDTA